MSSPDATLPPSEDTASHLSEAERIIDTFVAPSKTFTDIRTNSSWWMPVLIVFVVSIATSITLVRKVDLTEVVRQSIQNSTRAAQFEQLPKDQQESRIEQGAVFTKWIMYFIPVIGVILTLIFAAVYMAIFNFGLGTRVDFRHSMAIVAYSSMTGIVTAVLVVVVVFIADPATFDLQNPIATNPAAFFESTNAAAYWYRLLHKFDIIRLWSLALIALGFSKNSKLSFGTCAMTVGAIFLATSLLFSFVF